MSPTIRRLFPAVLLACSVLVPGAAWAAPKLPAMPESLPGEQRDVIYRLDLHTGTLMAIAPADLKEGRIYNHFSRRLHRRVWSYWLKQGRFWFAFGEGTTMDVWRFDVPSAQGAAEIGPQEEQQGVISQLELSGGQVAMRLRADGRWVIAGTDIVSSIFNVETGRRWENHGHYIPVIHLGGNSWFVADGKYVPAGTPMAGCGCY